MPEADIDTEIGEYLIPGEAEIIAEYVRIFQAHFRKHYEGKAGVTRRGIHAKSHGCLRATFEVFDHGDPALRHGIFRAPATYEAVVRLSSGDGPPGPDTDRIPSLGFAIKVTGVVGEKLLGEQTEPSQDFLFLNQPAYISADVRGYLSLMRAIDGGVFRRLYAAARNLRGILYRLKASPKDDPLNTPYWGVAPFRLGDTAVKYLIRPCVPVPLDKAKLRRIASADYLKKLVREHIEARDADYDFFLQKRLIDGNECRNMPIENYRVEWDEKKSVPIHVGRLRIPTQPLASDLDEQCEHTVFSPWNTTKDFRPLGSLNRARRVVYALSAQRRHELNDARRADGEPATTSTPIVWEAVHQHELKAVDTRRKAVHGESSDGDGKWTRGTPLPEDANTAAKALQAGMVGVSFSGGGIRSGTFCLGILQALAQLKLLTRIDYLSTVSGGGYIGGWLAAWIRRAKGEGGKQPVEVVQDHLGTQTNRCAVGVSSGQTEPEPETVHHLRAHSRFLAPQPGLLSLDFWTLLTIYVRNLFINLLVILPLLLVLAFGVRWAIAAFTGEPSWWWRLCCSVLFVLGLLGITLRARAQWREVAMQARDSQDPNRQSPQRDQRLWPAVVLPFAAVVVPFLAIWLGSPLINPEPVGYQAQLEHVLESRFPHVVQGSGMTKGIHKWCEREGGQCKTVGDWLFTSPNGGYRTWLEYLVAALSMFVLYAIAALIQPPPFPAADALRARKRFWLGVVLNAVVVGVLYVALINNILFIDGWSHPVLFATFGPPLFIFAVILGGYVEVIVYAKYMSEHEREWRSRAAALLFRVALFWIALFGVSAYLPEGLRVLSRHLGEPQDAGITVPWVAAVGWLLTTGLGYVLVQRSGASVGSGGLAAFIALRVVPVLFLVGLLAIASELTVLIIGPERPHRSYIDRLQDTYWGYLLTAFLLSSIAAVLALYSIPATRFSLHAMYMNRLTRCYLGASLHDAPPRDDDTRRFGPGRGEAGLPSIPPRRANPDTGFDPADDLPLAALRIADLPTNETRGEYLGPYPLFNTTLNLVSGDELAYQDRKGASFVLTPDYCGGPDTGYRQHAATNEEALKNLTLGRAVTISGAAVDANMANHQSPAFTAFLTILNARLGWWLENPRRSGPWAAAAPGSGGWWYLAELAGYTRQDTKYVHLSDGGHFENTGAYELIRRRCRYVVVVDAAEDPSDSSENLANLVQKVRTDFGIPIDLYTEPLRKDEKGSSKAHCAIGAIRYDEVDGSGVTGTLVFIRSSLTGDEEADLRNYAATHPPFPHHATSDQFFDEVQFESYRQLGFHIGMSVFREAVAEIALPADFPPADGYREFNRQLFAHLRRQWAPSPYSDKGYITSCRDYLRVTEQLRDTPALHNITTDLFPELRHLPPPAAPPEPPAGPEAHLHAVDYLLQVMELAWIENDLERHYANPLNRGWMNVFRRWTASNAFHRYWPVLRGQYSRGFVRFCERALNLDRLPVQWCRTAHIQSVHLDAILREMDEEFHREWGGVLQATECLSAEERRRYLSWVAGRSDWSGGEPLAWILTSGRGGEEPGAIGTWNPHAIPLGFVAVFSPRKPWVPWFGQRELLVWVRGGHRTLGIARECVPKLLRDEVMPEFRSAGVRKLLARYPLLGSSLADRLHRSLWEWFFFDLGFVRDNDNDHEATRETRLKRIVT